MTRTTELPGRTIPHIEGKRRAAIFRTSLAQCKPEVIASITVLINAVARQIVKTSPYIVNAGVAREHAEIWVAEKIFKAKSVVE